MGGGVTLHHVIGVWLAGGTLSDLCPMQLQNLIVDVLSLFLRPDSIPEEEGKPLGKGER